MRVEATALPGVLVVEPRVFPDSRGRFLESWRADRYAAAGLPAHFVQDNVSVSRRGVLRGLHLQHPHGQGKLVTALRGAVWDVAVDVRRGSPTFGRWFGCELSGESARQLWIPPGFAHGFVVVSEEEATVLYKCTETYHPEAETTVRWDDPALRIEWPVDRPVLSEKDLAGMMLAEVPEERLPQWRGVPAEAGR